MSVLVLKDCKVWYDKYNISGDLNELALEAECEMKDKTTFASSGWREFHAGLQVVNANFKGFYQADTDLIDPALWSRLETATLQPMSIGPITGAAGEVGYFFQAQEAKYTPGGTIGELMAIAFDVQGRGLLVRGTVMLNATLTATGTGTARNLGAVASGKKLYAAMHVLAASGTTPTLNMVIQSDDAETFLSPTDRITFTQATGKTAEWKEVAGPITDTWYRCSYTIAGTGPSFSVVVLVGIA